MNIKSNKNHKEFGLRNFFFRFPSVTFSDRLTFQFWVGSQSGRAATVSIMS